MERVKLIAKKEYYEKVKSQISSTDCYSEELEKRLADYRLQLEREYEAERQKDIEKVDHYLELLTDLIDEATREEAEAFAKQKENDEASEPDQIGFESAETTSKTLDTL